MTTQTQEVEELGVIKERIARIADEFDCSEESALQMLQIQQNQKIISQLKEIEIHSNNIVRQSYS